MLRSTNYRLYLVMTCYISSTWDADQFFSSWFRRPEEFRSILGQCEGVVSGSQALQFFETSHFTGSDLDIFLPPDSVDLLSCFLFREHYHFATGHHSGGSSYSTALNRIYRRSRKEQKSVGRILGVLDFVGNAKKKVQLIVVPTNPLKSILGFHSSKRISI